MSNEEENKSPPTSISVITLASSLSKAKKPKSKNFTQDEDLLLVSCYHTISQDGAVGVKQTLEEFWNRILDKFNANNKLKHGRTWLGLKYWWAQIQHMVNKFCACFDQVSARKVSGQVELDKINDAICL